MHSKTLVREPGSGGFRALLLFSALLSLPVGLNGQEGPLAGKDDRPEGLWYGISVGAAGARLTCDLCATGRDVGPAVEVGVGTWAGPRFRVGLDGGWWSHVQDDVRESVYRAGVSAQVHPSPDRGLFVTAGLGWSGYRAGDFGLDAPRLTLGAGWDLPLTDGWVVGNSVLLDAASFGAMRNADTPVVRDVGLSLVRLSVHVRSRGRPGADRERSR